MTVYVHFLSYNQEKTKEYNFLWGKNQKIRQDGFCRYMRD